MVWPSTQLTTLAKFHAILLRNALGGCHSFSFAGYRLYLRWVRLQHCSLMTWMFGLSALWTTPLTTLQQWNEHGGHRPPPRHPALACRLQLLAGRHSAGGTWL
jgi:hypothetical protein